MSNTDHKTKVALLINMISPARIPLYSSLAAAFDLLILHGGREANRDSWAGSERAIPKAKIIRAWGWQIPFARKKGRQVFDEQYLHIHLSYFWHLVRFSPDVVVSSELGVRTLLAILYGALFRRPVWVWWGGSLHTERQKAGRLKRFLRPLMARWVRDWISYGESSTPYLESLGIPRNQILEVQNAANEDFFRVPAKAQFDIQLKPVLLYVGQFIARKGINHFLRSAAELQKEGLTFSLLLVGGGRDQQAIEQLSNELGLSHVHFHPTQPPQLMPGIYRSADALIFPTMEDPWGLVANEAMLAGLPVLCSKYAGCAEELFPAENIFDPENAAEFREKLRLAISGRLPPPDLTRLKSSAQVAADLIAALRLPTGRRNKQTARKPQFAESTVHSSYELKKEEMR